jgi:hypothetical protein
MNELEHSRMSLRFKVIDFDVELKQSSLVRSSQIDAEHNAWIKQSCFANRAIIAPSYINKASCIALLFEAIIMSSWQVQSTANQSLILVILPSHFV